MYEVICDICEESIEGNNYYCTSEVTVCKRCCDRISEPIPSRSIDPLISMIYREGFTVN